MKHTLELNDGKLVYEYENPSTWEKDGKTYEFISFKKVTTFKDAKKYQNLTVKMEDWIKFSSFLREILDNEETKDVPF